jgi:cell division protein FtsA
MIKNISIGIDVGSQTTRVVVGEFTKGEKTPKILGIGESETRGLRHGYVVDQDLAATSIKSAVEQAEKNSNMKIKRAYLALSGTSLRGVTASGTAIISKADGEVTTLDINKATLDAEDNLNLNNKKIIQVFPLSFKLDGKDVQGRLEGMRGTKLEVKTLFITYSMVHLEDLLSTLAMAGVETIDVIPSPLANMDITLTEKQKIVGVALVDIGAETTTLAVYENGKPISLHSWGIGSLDITNDIALGFKIPLERAEALKRGVSDETYSKKKLEEIVEARLSDIFEVIDNHLKKIKRSELLPAGIVFVGGGANIPLLVELSKSVLKLPSAVGNPEIFGNSKTKLRDFSWFTALGLLTIAKTDSVLQGSFGNIFKDLKNALKSSIKHLLP